MCGQPWKAFSAPKGEDSPFTDPIEVNLFTALSEPTPITKQLRAASSATDLFGVWVNLFPNEARITDFVKTIEHNKAGTDSSEEPRALQYTWGLNVQGGKGAAAKYNFFEVYDR